MTRSSKKDVGELNDKLSSLEQKTQIPAHNPSENRDDSIDPKKETESDFIKGLGGNLVCLDYKWVDADLERKRKERYKFFDIY